MKGGKVMTRMESRAKSRVVKVEGGREAGKKRKNS
jgi:hypothetical protein